MRKENPSLSSEERLDNSKWLLQGTNLFGFIRQEKGKPSIIAVFNNSGKSLDSFPVFMPKGITGNNNWNFIRKDSNGNYGDYDPDVEWTDDNVMKISKMAPWEAKIIKINK